MTISDISTTPVRHTLQLNYADFWTFLSWDVCSNNFVAYNFICINTSSDISYIQFLWKPTSKYIKQPLSAGKRKRSSPFK